MTEYIQIMKALCLTGAFIMLSGIAAFVIFAMIEIYNDKTTRK